MFKLKNMPITINSAAKVSIAGKINVNSSGTWIFPFNASYSIIDSPDSNATGVNLGTVFRCDQPGYIKQIRFWKTTGNTGSHIGSLWTTGGTQLNQVNFSGESAVGWQYATFSAATFVSANTSYVISLFVPLQNFPNVFYFGMSSYFAILTNSYIRTGSNYAVYGDDIYGPNGVYTYGNSTAFPTSTFLNTCYFIDALFDTVL